MIGRRAVSREHGTILSNKARFSAPDFYQADISIGLATSYARLHGNLEHVLCGPLYAGEPGVFLYFSIQLIT